MRRGSWRPIAGTILLAIAGCGGDSGADRPPQRATPHVTRDCTTRVEGTLAPDWRRKSVTVGPLSFVYARLLARDDRRRGLVDEKMLVVLRAAHEATVVVPASDRRRVSLDYDGFDRKRNSRVSVSDGVRAVRFIACRGNEETFSSKHSLRRETQFNGGIIAHRPSCVRLDVFVDGRDTPERRTISFGAGRCS